jgi:4'-phosphopantetheinyl transferase
MPVVDQSFDLPERVVDVWEAGLDLAADELQTISRLLSPAERDRAARFLFERDRRRFAAGRGRLRQLLGRYADASPSAIVIETRASGKPFSRGELPLDFNLSHADDRVVFAFAHCPIGIDVERIRPLPDLLAIAARFFAPGEYDAMQRLTGAPLQDTFFRCWTLKEAYLKAVGDGLSVPLSAFEVNLDPCEPRMLSCDRDPDEPSRWQFAAWADGGFAIALAIAADTGSVLVRRRSWPPGVTLDRSFSANLTITRPGH